MTVAGWLQTGASGLISLTYTSEVNIAAEDVDDAIAAILDRAQSFNSTNDVTGALIFTGGQFAQTLEGPGPVVERLLRGIQEDGRHLHLVVIDRRHIEARTFPRWAMAYAGPSVFVSRTVGNVRTADHKHYARAVDRLLRLITEFGRHPVDFHCGEIDHTQVTLAAA